jgi:hypothetical protein
MVLFAGHSDTVFALVGNAILAAVTSVGFARQRGTGWFLLCFWAILDLAASVIEALISFDYIALQHAAPWIELRSILWLLAKLSLLFGVCVLAFRRRTA